MNHLLEVKIIYKLSFYESFGTASLSIKKFQKHLHNFHKVEVFILFYIFRSQSKSSEIGWINCWSLYFVRNRENNFSVLFLRTLNCEEQRRGKLFDQKIIFELSVEQVHIVLLLLRSDEIQFTCNTAT